MPGLSGSIVIEKITTWFETDELEKESVSMAARIERRKVTTSLLVNNRKSITIP